MQSLAVVPIFVNAGAALLPALIAALTSLLALLLSPRALLSLCRRKPWIPALLILLVPALYYSPRLFPSPVPTPTLPATNNPIDWPAIARDLLRQQHSTHSLLTELWHHDLDGNLPLSTPALFIDSSPGGGGNTTLYLPTTFLDVAKRFGILFAIDAQTGKTRWTTTTQHNNEDLKPFYSSPAISTDGASLLVGQGLHEDANCPLLCFNIQSQTTPATVTWSVKTPLHVESSPAIFTRHGKQFVVVGAGAIEGPDRLPIGNPGFVLCAQLATGKQLWQFPLYDPESSPAVDDDGIIYIGSGFNGSAVVALRSDPDEILKDAPRQLWRTKTPHPAVGDALLASHPTLGNIVLISGGNGDAVFSDPNPAGFVMALDRATGKTLWTTPLPDTILGRLTLANPHPTPESPSPGIKSLGSPLVLAGCRDGQAYALDLASGKILWQSPISATANIPVLAGLAADSSHAFALASDGTLAILSLSDGNLLERLALSDASKSPQNLSLSTPILHDHILYVPTESTGLHAFRINPN